MAKTQLFLLQVAYINNNGMAVRSGGSNGKNNKNAAATTHCARFIAIVTLSFSLLYTSKKFLNHCYFLFAYFLCLIRFLLQHATCHMAHTGKLRQAYAYAPTYACVMALLPFIMTYVSSRYATLAEQSLCCPTEYLIYLFEHSFSRFSFVFWQIGRLADWQKAPATRGRCLLRLFLHFPHSCC